MKKINVLWTILYLIFLIVFNLIFYMVGGTDHPASVWISYFFIHFAYVMLVCTPFLTKKGRDAALLTNMIADEHTGAASERREAELQYVKEVSMRLKAVMQDLGMGKTARELERAYDLIHSSPVKTNPQVADLEYAVFRELDHLEKAAAQNNEAAVIESADKLMKLAGERNRKLKLLQ